MNRWTKITPVPLASDLKLLRDFLTFKANGAIERLKKNNSDKNAYLELLETVFCRVILLNSRRPGELQRLPLHIYLQTETESTQKYEEFTDVISPAEQILM